jgi:hypothetical protein
VELTGNHKIMFNHCEPERCGLAQALPPLNSSLELTPAVPWLAQTNCTAAWRLHFAPATSAVVAAAALPWRGRHGGPRAAQRGR